MTAPAPRIGVIGLGYVGLPLAVVFAEAGVPVLGLDSSVPRVAQVNAGESYIEDVPSPRLAPLVEQGLIQATTSWDGMGDVEAVIICLPTPLDEHREPDLSAVLGATETLAGHLTKGQLVVLESTTYPGTTREELAPLLEASGLIAGEDFHLAFSPERVDPGREDWTTRSTPKVVGGLTPLCTEKVVAVYGLAFDSLVPVSSPEVAEMTKILENVFRSVNIALVNETAMLCDRMGVDVWEVIDAAATKPFGYMPFRPGPGLGGHCIPIDPFYLTWKAREFDFHTEFIELAGKINSQMPYFCVAKLARALNDRKKAIKGSTVLVIGVAYKADVNDMRESPALKVISLLLERGANVRYHDPHVPALEPGHGLDVAMASVPLDDAELAGADVVAVVTAHSGIDWAHVADVADLVVDFRNAVPRGENVWTL
ncbi:MAG: nucleotide sugar dehydrogenase [Actinobacteria bacterium]|nr:nucleotide sugar dehydrogenase [Actinomycetota bacterium]